MLTGTTTGPWGASTGLGQGRRVTPVETTSQEAWPGAEPLGSAVPLARTVVERRWASAPGKARAAPAGAASTASVGVPSSFSSSFILERAQSADRDGAGPPPPASSDEDRCRERSVRRFHCWGDANSDAGASRERESLRAMGTISDWRDPGGQGRTVRCEKTVAMSPRVNCRSR
jgi:hypothetical protein